MLFLLKGNMLEGGMVEGRRRVMALLEGIRERRRVRKSVIKSVRAVWLMRLWMGRIRWSVGLVGGYWMLVGVGLGLSK